MPRGQPDYGIYTETPVASGISDPGEAAARLGSINIYDRRGWTVWMDDFEGPSLKWGVVAVGATAPVLYTGLPAWMGAQCVYFVTGAAPFEVPTIRRLFPLIRHGLLGVEFWVNLWTAGDGSFSFEIETYDGTNVSAAHLSLSQTTREAWIETDTGWERVSTRAFNTALRNGWMPFKLVIDVDTDRYVRLLAGPEEIDLSAHALVPGAVTADYALLVEFRLYSTIAGVQTALLDNFILTQNEP